MVDSSGPILSKVIMVCWVSHLFVQCELYAALACVVTLAVAAFVYTRKLHVHSI
jgi:hypothetical protein